MRLIKLSEVMLRTGFKKTAIYSWVKTGSFHSQLKLVDQLDGRLRRLKLGSRTNLIRGLATND